MQLEFKAHKFFVVTINDFKLELGDTRNLIILLDYIKEWRLTIWGMGFF
jgi:hypothetical protein